jgi:hypothetical protein
MWRTGEGNRVLQGVEADLFRESLYSVVDWTETWPEQPIGVRVFDQLSQTEKLAILDDVSRALLVKRIPCPVHTAVNEGTIAAIYYQLANDVEVEIDEGIYDLRKLIRNASRECEIEGEVPHLRSDKIAEWREVIDELMFRILWDVDWEGGIIEPDDPPDKANMIRDFMRVDPDYYSAVPIDPNPAQLKKIRARLRRRLGFYPEVL